MILQQRAQEDRLAEAATKLRDDAVADEVGLLDEEPEGFIYRRFLRPFQASPHLLGKSDECTSTEDQHFRGIEEVANLLFSVCHVDQRTLDHLQQLGLDRRVKTSRVVVDALHPLV